MTPATATATATATERFAAAIAYDKSVKDDPKAIAAAHERGQTAFNWAVADYLAK